MATMEDTAASRSATWLHKRRSLVIATLMAGVALASAVVGAIVTSGNGGVGGINLVVESLSGGSATFLGNVSTVIPLGFAFGAGMVSAVNPCGFSMLPAYLGLYLATLSKKEERIADPVNWQGSCW